MNEPFEQRLRAMSAGIILGILTLLFGFFLGLIFGAAEDSIKGRLAASGKAVLATIYENDPAKMKVVLDKSWVYMQRAHLHAGGMGTTALALSILLAGCRVSNRSRAITSGALGFGGLGYSIYWMWAGFRAPGIGGTHAARESLDWLAIPCSGMFVVATIAVLVLFILSLRRTKNEEGRLG